MSRFEKKAISNPCLDLTLKGIRWSWCHAILSLKQYHMEDKGHQSSLERKRQIKSKDSKRYWTHMDQKSQIFIQSLFEDKRFRAYCMRLSSPQMRFLFR